MPRLPTLRWTCRTVALAVVLAVAAVIALTFLDRRSPDPVETSDVSIDVPAGPDEAGTVRIDAELYLPDATPAPAVLLAHGFGGSKDSVAAQAQRLARDGFVVLAYSARGFGLSSGSIHLNDPDREVADARELVTWLAQRPEVELDAPGDPRVGVAGASYGGALALMLGGTDSRIDSIGAAITWNDLTTALFPNSGAPVDSSALPETPANVVGSGPGVLKRGWAGVFFGVGAQPGGTAERAPGLTGDLCGRFAESVCTAYAPSAISGAPTPELAALLRSHSPAPYAGNITAPTLLIQGERDTLFGLDQADATAREITANGTPVEVRWFSGGHDGNANWADSTVRAWLRNTLRDDDPGTAPFNFALQGTPNEDGSIPSRRMSADGYPGLAGNPAVRRTGLGLSSQVSGPQTVIRPPGASPAAVSSVPGLGSAVSSALSVAGLDIGLDPPGQSATFRTPTQSAPLSIVGSPTVDLRVHSFAPPGEAVLFVKLYDVSSEGRRLLPGGAVAPVRLPDSAEPVDVRVTLPPIAHRVLDGHHIEIVVGTTDQAYAVPTDPAVFSVDLADAQLQIPSVDGAIAARDVPLTPLFGIAAIAAGLVVLVGVTVVRARRRSVIDADPALADVPLVVSGLRKTYANGFRAVDDVSFTVRPGQVLGLLGPNGAGKTTTLRMVLGLISPGAGEVRIFGHKVGPGAPVLSRVGAFVEGPGLLPHLSGADNLAYFWRSTGRPAEDARFDEVIRIADLGAAIDRKARSYSHGMKQRLAIAQAMLGLPDLLILDEPTNGLDPPQIRTMRDVLIEYARGGRTVVVSSHLLAEVEQTCTDVVVMNQGTVIGAGSVRDLVAAGGPTEFRVDDAARAVAVVSVVPGVGDVTQIDARRIRVDIGSTSVPDVVKALVDADVAVSAATPSTKLEDVFLALVHDPRATARTKEVAR